MVGWSSIIFFAIGMALYRTLFTADPGFIDSVIVGGIIGAIGGGISALYQHYFGKHNASIMNIIDNLLWFILFCIPGAIIGAVISGVIKIDQTIVILSVMLIIAIPLTIRKIKKKEKLLKRDFFEDLH